MEDSILTSIKQMLGISEDEEAFDPEIIAYINAVLSDLNQIGVGPSDGFQIQDDRETWKDFIQDNPKLSQVKPYIYMKVKLIFDPPTSSSLVEVINSSIREIEWRLSNAIETGI